MHKDPIRHNRPVSAALHPLVYRAAIGLALWFALSAWVFFSGGDMGLALGIVSAFMLIAVAIPWLIWRTWRKFPGSGAAESNGGSLREWLSGEFEAYEGRMNARDAAIEILLPLAAVSFGITAFGIVLLFTTTGAG